MNLTSKIVVAGAAAICIGVLASFLTERNNAYEEQLQVQREAKNSYFRGSPDSPMPDSLKNRWLPLHYYPIDAKYKITASVEQASPPVSYSDELEIQAYLTFDLAGKHYRWAGLCPKLSPKGEFLLAFKDQTSGKTTYAGGRYIDVVAAGSQATIDFNTAYLPYCAFNAEYVCPVAPVNNLAEIAIEAGERLP